MQVVPHAHVIRSQSSLQIHLCKITQMRCQQTLPLPVILAKGPQRRLNNAFVSVVAYSSGLVTVSTYCLGIGTEGLLGDLWVLASREVKGKICIPKDIWKRNTVTNYLRVQVQDMTYFDHSWKYIWEVPHETQIKNDTILSIPKMPLQ